MDFVARVRATLSARALVRGERGVLLAVSGGPDSTALLLAMSDLARPLGLTLGVCTVDHGLRREAADEARFVEGLARAADLPFVGARLDPPPVGHEAARAARYAALEVARTRLGLDLLATAHTRSDQAETVLIRLLRGTGLAGLGAIPPRRGAIIRPLVDVGRDEVLAFLASRGVRACEDPSNADRRTLRARVRHDLLPLLVREAPDLEGTLAALADEARAASAERDAAIPYDYGSFGSKKGSNIPDEVDPAAGAARALRQALRRVGLSAERRHVDAILRMLGVLPRRSPRAPACAASALAPGAYRLAPLGVEVDVPAALVPADVRNRRPGDYLSSGKSLKDFLREAGIPAELRGFVPVVARGRLVLALPAPLGDPAGTAFRFDDDATLRGVLTRLTRVEGLPGADPTRRI